MSDTNSDLDPAEKPDEISLLKQRARMMGIEFSNNIGLQTLRERIKQRMESQAEAPAPVAPVVPEAPGTNPLATQNATLPEKKMTLRQMLVQEEMRLVRLRITNLDPKKKDLPGEILTIANEFLGTVRKFIPYGEVTDNGFHVPWCLYQMLESRRFLNIRTTKGRNGQIRVEQSWAKEFALDVLPPLTKVELERLATAQTAAGSLNTD